MLGSAIIYISSLGCKLTVQLKLFRAFLQAASAQQKKSGLMLQNFKKEINKLLKQSL